MKRPICDGEELIDINKKQKIHQEEVERDREGKKAEEVLLDENLLYEVLRHADARTLAVAACVSRQWNRTAQDERLWELICTKQNAYYPQQLRAVVLALGGFRQLFFRHLWPLLKQSSSSSSAPPAPPASIWPCLPPSPAPPPSKSIAGKTHWGKDEVNLSLSLLSIRYYEKMNLKSRGK